MPLVNIVDYDECRFFANVEGGIGFCDKHKTACPYEGERSKCIKAQMPFYTDNDVVIF